MTRPALEPTDLLAHAKSVLRQEASAIRQLGDLLGAPFLQAVQLLRDCKGMVVVSGMGKAGLIGAKVSATLTSTGTRSHFLHPAEAVHGDLGRIFHEDVVLCLSRSGTTEEVVRLLEPLKRIGASLIAVTSFPESPLGRHSDVCLDIGRVVEACPLGLAPTTSTSVMLALGDALAMTVMPLREFSKKDFALFHPAGTLGRRLLTVREVMRQGGESPSIATGTSLSEALQKMTDTRAGCVGVVDATDRLIGVFTDGDLRRRLLDDHGFELDRTIDEVMQREPKTIGPGHLAGEALRRMKEDQLDQILVVDDDAHLIGLLDVQDLLAVELI